MKIKKIVALLIALIICIISMSVTAFASGRDLVQIQSGIAQDGVFEIGEDLTQGQSGTTTIQTSSGSEITYINYKDGQGADRWISRTRWNYIASIVHGITFSGRTGKVVVSFTTGSGTYTAKVYYQIQQKVNGTWKAVYTSGTYSDTFSCFISNKHSLAIGTYRVCTVGSVYSGNTFLEKATSYSNEYYCY